MKLVALMALFARALRSGRYDEALILLRAAGLEDEQALAFLADSISTS